MPFMDNLIHLMSSANNPFMHKPFIGQTFYSLKMMSYSLFSQYNKEKSVTVLGYFICVYDKKYKKMNFKGDRYSKMQS